MSGIYVHIPFCLRKCGYCQFYSVPTGGGVPDGFIEAVLNECRFRSAIHAEQVPIQTVYLGGGTPSLLTPLQVDTVLGVLQRRFTIPEDSEISIEANPQCVKPDMLAAYRSMGINRISLGVQSFWNDELDMLGRIHDARQARRACRTASESGIRSISFDLIYGLPEQSLSRWAETLKEALDYRPDHLSTYELTWSQSTPLGRRIEAGLLARPDTETVCEMFLLTDRMLTDAGYEHYEVSNYALPGFRCRHNEATWTRKTYIGLGPSAHSFDGAVRSWNASDLEAYHLALSEHRLPCRMEERIDSHRRRLERISLGLRRSEGIPVRWIPEKGREIMYLLEADLARVSGSALRLTARGYLLADEICLRLAA